MLLSPLQPIRLSAIVARGKRGIKRKSTEMKDHKPKNTVGSTAFFSKAMSRDINE